MFHPPLFFQNKKNKKQPSSLGQNPVGFIFGSIKLIVLAHSNNIPNVIMPTSCLILLQVTSYNKKNRQYSQEIGPRALCVWWWGKCVCIHKFVCIRGFLSQMENNFLNVTENAVTIKNIYNGQCVIKIQWGYSKWEHVVQFWYLCWGTRPSCT